jgi:hypothetical protein
LEGISGEEGEKERPREGDKEQRPYWRRACVERETKRKEQGEGPTEGEEWLPIVLKERLKRF